MKNMKHDVMSWNDDINILQFIQQMLHENNRWSLTENNCLFDISSFVLLLQPFIIDISNSQNWIINHFSKCLTKMTLHRTRLFIYYIILKIFSFTFLQYQPFAKFISIFILMIIYRWRYGWRTNLPHIYRRINIIYELT